MRRRRQTSICAECRDEILDQYILRVSPDLEWHVGCLRCTHCQQTLDETCTCFVRDEQPYCKRDYVRYKLTDKHPWAPAQGAQGGRRTPYNLVHVDDAMHFLTCRFWFPLITGPPTHSVGGSIVLLSGVCRRL